MDVDHGIENLLDLDGTVIEADSELEYYVHFDVKRVDCSEGRPHGIKYSLTLRDKWNNRLMGFDNAHPVKAPGSGFIRHRMLNKYDHQHTFRNVAVIIPYEYFNAEQLLVDFWASVDEALRTDCRSTDS